ncbi:hypothetical protein NLJ89_g9356 [Agrocybe chaxingu]|uniref:MYND-type domain-containing protein n=1 Tax=Agrocybe chaxingu TaxID=84603 RepID=A0A9W8MPY2_9AGAR|nr:hypothetical protein NLJ89_g9356 [Agrocybe chaxingu]
MKPSSSKTPPVTPTTQKDKKKTTFPTTCTNCLNVPSDKKNLQKCARCKAVWYCSRECQKQDWPVHKAECCDTPSQFGFIFKMILNINKDDILMHKLRLATAHQLRPFLTSPTRPDPATYVLNVSLVLCLRPCSEDDFTALRTRKDSIGPLLAKEMYGGLRFIDVVDTSDLEKYPMPPVAHERFLDRWRKHREFLDRQGKTDTYAVLLQFNYNSKSVYLTDMDLHPNDCHEARMMVYQSALDGTRQWRRPGNSILRLINADFARQEQEVKKLRCVMGDEDKQTIRDCALYAAE